MQKAFEKIVERLMLASAGSKVYKLINPNKEDIAEFNAYKKAIEIVNQVAEEYKSTEHINCSTDDSISRSVLIDKLQKWKFANEERGYDTAKDLVQEMIDLVKEQLPEAVNDGWIPCEERLPKEYVEVLAYGREGYVYLATLYDTEIYGKVWKQWNGGDLRLDWIIAWQPFPQPYVKEK